MHVHSASAGMQGLSLRAKLASWRTRVAAGSLRDQRLDVAVDPVLAPRDPWQLEDTTAASLHGRASSSPIAAARAHPPPPTASAYQVAPRRPDLELAAAEAAQRAELLEQQLLQDEAAAAAAAASAAAAADPPQPSPVPTHLQPRRRFVPVPGVGPGRIVLEGPYRPPFAPEGVCCRADAPPPPPPRSWCPAPLPLHTHLPATPATRSPPPPAPLPARACPQIPSSCWSCCSSCPTRHASSSSSRPAATFVRRPRP